MKTTWKRPAVMAIVAVLMVTAIPMIAHNVAAAGDQTYYFYVDTTNDKIQNGHWISGSGPDDSAAFINAANNAFGPENNVISPGPWIVTLNGVTASPWTDYGMPGYHDWQTYGWNGTGWDSSNAYIGTGNATNREYAVFSSSWDGFDYAAGLATLDQMQNITANDALMSSSRLVTLTFKAAETQLRGFDVSVTYNQSQLTYVSWANLCPISITNGSGPGVIYMNAAGSDSFDATSGLFTITFSVKSGVATGESVIVGATLNSFDSVDHPDLVPPFLTTFAHVVISGEYHEAAYITPTTNVTAGDVVTLVAGSDNSGLLDVDFNTNALRLVSATNASLLVTNDGNLWVHTADPFTEVKVVFVVVDSPVLGDTAIVANGETVIAHISTSSYVIVPEVANGTTTVSLYKVPEIAGFKMVFSYTGEAPIVNDLARLSTKGGFSTSVDATNHTLTVVWAASANVDLNGDLFSVTADNLTLPSANNAELRYIAEDLSSVRASVGIAHSLKEAQEKDPHYIAPIVLLGDLNDDGSVTLADLILLMQYLADYDVNINLKNADMNENGIINIVDAMLLQEIITGN